MVLQNEANFLIYVQLFGMTGDPMGAARALSWDW
jgi:hypothetical protein